MVSKTSIGKILSDKRNSQGLKYEHIESELKIKEKYIKFLENNEFDKFNSTAQAKGFLRNYARLLELNDEQLLALYRRDVENLDMKRKIVLQEDTPEEELEEPKVTENLINKLKDIKLTRKRLSLFGGITIVLITVIYIGITIINAFEKPILKITSPFEIEGPFNGSVVYEDNEIVLAGVTERGVTILINNSPVRLTPTFEFESSAIPTTTEESTVSIKAENALGSETEIILKLKKGDNKLDRIVSRIEVTGASSSLVIKADEVQIYNGIAAAGDSIQVEANTKLEVSSGNPELIKVFIDDKEYEFASGYVVYELVEGEITIK